MFTKLFKATIAVALSPVALVVDVVTLPASAEKRGAGPFDRTSDLLKTAGKNIKDAIK